MKEDHALNIDLCDKFVQPFIFTGFQRVKTGFYKRSSVSSIDSWFIYDAMEHQIVP